VQEPLVALDRLGLAAAVDRLEPRRRHLVEAYRRSCVRDERPLLARGLHVDGERLGVPLAPEATLRPLAAIGVAVADLVPDGLPAPTLIAQAPVVDGTDVRHGSSLIAASRLVGCDATEWLRQPTSERRPIYYWCRSVPHATAAAPAVRRVLLQITPVVEAAGHVDDCNLRLGWPMAWMAMMGADSVAYHYANAAERADDHPGRALEYYASRGETPLRWGGSGAVDLGLVGRVTRTQFGALYGPGGAVDPTTGERLVRTRRPGMELVIAAHKSVAELGVIGRAEDMHRIMDAERDATLAYLDAITCEVGGRRGRAGARCPTSGLVYAHTRHATSRAGDPNPHDHVLVANLVFMEDDAGGWKAATTALWREHLHAATMVGRLAGAREAVRLGYGIVPDDGPSGRLRHWAIAGVPEEAMAVHSKRAAEIGAEMDRLGYASYRAKAIVARNNRDPKRHEPVGALMARWQAELASVGWPVEELARSVEAARPPRGRRPPPLHAFEQRRLIAEVLAPEGPLAERKVFTRRDVVVALAPHLFGHDPAELEVLAERVLADAEAVALVAVASASESPYATATTMAREAAIAAAVAVEVARADAPAVDDLAARRAVAAQEADLGASLTLGQREAVVATATSGRGTELIVGVAGSGKTTALAALRRAFEAGGFRVLGTSTSGQAARTLGRAAGIEPSRTLASLAWRLEHGQEAFDDHTVVILDEAAMTEDRHLLGLLGHAARAGAKVVMVGDHRQLGAVGPGGGFEALVARYGAAVHVLADNLRQREGAERAALALLRDGNVARAAAWYARNGRIVVASDRIGAIGALVEGWAGDVAEIDSVAMYAYRRANVAELNRRGRQVWRALGRLQGPDLVAPGGGAYAVGDRVLALAPGAGTVTSETASVVAVDPSAPSLTLRMDDGGAIRRLVGPEIGADRLAHAYAVTVTNATQTVFTGHWALGRANRRWRAA
jgi:conjugative relaxase-like TrwC/TraI family protein